MKILWKQGTQQRNKNKPSEHIMKHCVLFRLIPLITLIDKCMVDSRTVKSIIDSVRSIAK